ncbi:hypothetical protein EKO04_003940 [Ascochyta lentis]|uniref:Enoyl reductase (ER) domain-containing protein n=1 Tax=Ascochyta lentis TaxID=205686 RepID=A0A8H7J798_9PLEO|nr:hypothetical protein EKO04_003940 [Ascochyta lentis]
MTTTAEARSTEAVPAKMRAAVLHQFNEPYQVQNVDTPSAPEGHDLLVRVLAASYCHTDAVFASGAMSQALPRVGCHEFAGRIVAMGPDVASEALQLAVGVEVGVPGRPYHACGACRECRRGAAPFCPHILNLGLTTDGGFRDFALVDSRQVAPLPSQPAPMTAVQAAPLMCAGLTVWSALELARTTHGARKVAIMGAGGGLGHLAVQFAAHLDLAVLAVDAQDAALELLRAVVATLDAPAQARVTVADARRLDVASALAGVGEQRADEGLLAGVDAVLLLPESQAAFNTGMQLLRNHGTMVVVSFPSRGFVLDAGDVVFRDIRVVGSLVGRNQQLRDMLAFAAAHGIAAVTRSFALEHINDLVSESHRGAGGKLVIDMLAELHSDYNSSGLR